MAASIDVKITGHEVSKPHILVYLLLNLLLVQLVQDTYVKYNVCVSLGSEVQWKIEKRYTQFEEFHYTMKVE